MHKNSETFQAGEMFLFFKTQWQAVAKSLVNSSVCNNKIFEILIGNIYLRFCDFATVFREEPYRVGLSVSVGLARQYSGWDTQ